MSSIYNGAVLRLSVFGQSHAEAVGMTLEGLPAGVPVDLDALQIFLNRRAPGRNDWSTSRREEDCPEFLCGLKDGKTCGAPLTAIIRNRNTRSSDYEQLRCLPRPGHADYTAQLRYGGFQDVAGGGHFSGRLTAPLCIAGGILLQMLEAKGIRVEARIRAIAGIRDDSPFTESVAEKDFPTVSDEAGEQMKAAIQAARAEGDSVGGIVECVIRGVPGGLGSPMFDGVEGGSCGGSRRGHCRRGSDPGGLNMELKDYRKQLDEIDGKLLSLFAERMNIVAEIARWKQENHFPVLDSGREEEKLRQAEAKSPPELAEYSRKLFSVLMELSRGFQDRILHAENKDGEVI